MSSQTRITRSDWPDLVAAFKEFFAGIGSVATSAEEAVFDAGMTGLALNRDGSSRSFMPLHGLEATWDAVVFDQESREVTLLSDSSKYVYRVPPGLIG